MRCYKRKTSKAGDVAELLYPADTLHALSEVLRAHRSVPLAPLMQVARSKLERAKLQKTTIDGSFVHCLDAEKYESLALTLAWEHGCGTRVPRYHVIVALNGDSTDIRFENLYCLPRSELLGWMRFVRVPIEAHIARLEKQIMHLRTTDDAKRALLGVLDTLVDPDKQPDYMRQRAVCETVSVLVGLLKVDVAYIRAIDGDGVIPFLEPARAEAQRRREAAGKRQALLGGPAPNHPWRGLGNRKD